MTNEEKAKEIELSVYAFGEKPKGEFQAPAYRAALEMAEWKDKQFKEYLEAKRQKIVSILEDITEEDARHFALYQRYVYLGIIIDELFKEEQK